MNKFFNNISPVGNIKIPLMLVVGFYIFVLLNQLKTDVYLQRSIPLENRQDGGVVILKGVKHQVPFKTEKTLIKFDIDSISDFLLLPNGEENEALITTMVQLIICIMFELLMWKLDFADPFNSARLNNFIWLCNWLMVLFMIEAFKNTYTVSWVANASHGLGHFKYKTGLDVFYYIILVWVVRMIISFYRKGVNAHQELKLTI